MKKKSFYFVSVALLHLLTFGLISCGNVVEVLEGSHTEENGGKIAEVEELSADQINNIAKFTIYFGKKSITERKLNPDYDSEISYENYHYRLSAAKINEDNTVGEMQLIHEFDYDPDSPYVTASILAGKYSFLLQAGSDIDGNFSVFYQAAISEQDISVDSGNDLTFALTPVGEQGKFNYEFRYKDNPELVLISPSVKYINYSTRNTGTYTDVAEIEKIAVDGYSVCKINVPLDPGLYIFQFILENTSGTESKKTVHRELVKIDGGYYTSGEYTFELVNYVVSKPTVISAEFVNNNIDVNDTYELNVRAQTPNEGGWLTFNYYASQEQITNLDTALKSVFIVKDVEFEAGGSDDNDLTIWNWQKIATSNLGTYYFYVAVKNHYYSPIENGRELVSEPVYYAVETPLVVSESPVQLGINIQTATQTVSDVMNVALESRVIEKTNYVVLLADIEMLDTTYTVGDTSWEINDGTIPVSKYTVEYSSDMEALLSKAGITLGSYYKIFDTSKLREDIGVSDVFTITLYVDVTGASGTSGDSYDATFSCLLSEVQNSGSSGIDQFTFYINVTGDNNLLVTLDEDPEFSSSVARYELVVVKQIDNEEIARDTITDSWTLPLSEFEPNQNYEFSINAYDSDENVLAGRVSMWTCPEITTSGGISFNYEINSVSNSLVITLQFSDEIVSKLSNYSLEIKDKVNGDLIEGGTHEYSGNLEDISVELSKFTSGELYEIILVANSADGTELGRVSKEFSNPSSSGGQQSFNIVGHTVVRAESDVHIEYDISLDDVLMQAIDKLDFEVTEFKNNTQNIDLPAQPGIVYNAGKLVQDPLEDSFATTGDELIVTIVVKSEDSIVGTSSLTFIYE